MSIYGAMFSGVSGLFAQSTKISAISDNISNANTVGYKRTEVPFSTLVTTQGLKNSYAAGGVRANPSMQIDRQGLLNATSSSTDLAINGEGFFVVNTAPEAATGNIANRTLFTRAGSFEPDANGFLRNTAGFYLQGWKLDSGGAFLNGEPPRTSFASLETVNVTGLNFTGSPTGTVTFAGNLPAGETGGDIPGNPIQTGVEYFDPLGNPKTMNMQWTPGTDYGAWTLDLVPAGETVPVSSYNIQFHTSGPNSGAPASISEVPSVIGSKNLATNTDNPNTFAGDTITITVSGSAVTGAGETISGTIGGTAFTDYTTVAEDVDSNTLAENLATHLDGLGLTGVSSVTANASGRITITGTDDVNGAGLIEGGATTLDDGGGVGVTEVVDNVAGNEPATLAGDVVELDVAGGAAGGGAGDGTTAKLGGTTLPPLTVPPGGYANDNALALAVAGHIDSQAASIPGYTAGSFSVSDSRIILTGDTDVTGQGASLAGGSGSINALQVTRDTTGATQFVDEDGVPTTPTAQGDPIIARIDVALPGGATQTLDFDLGEIETLDGITQFAGDYAPTLIERDGAQFGSLDRIEVSEDGIVSAVFNNGQTRPLYQVPLVDFVNPNGLLPVDGNAFQATVDAGAFYMWDPGVGPAGEIASSSLEASTVDIAEEFSNMIIAQRAYSSNARIIQTADEMLQEITNLKR